MSDLTVNPPIIRNDDELAWSRYRRRLMAIARTESNDYYEQRLRDLLDEHWTLFSEALERGEVLALPSATDDES